MKSMRGILAAIGFAVSAALSPASANNFSTDQSDLWWIPAESGWGMQLVQRGSFIFSTLFVFNQLGSATWFTGQLSNVGGFVWSGPLFATSGPFYGTVPFNPGFVNTTPVGTMTWSAISVNTGQLVYNVGPVNVTKNVTRQTLALDNFSGIYGGGSHQVTTGCTNPAGNGTFNVYSSFDITQSGTSWSMTSAVVGTSLSCTFTGTYAQSGQMGNSNGNYTCNNGDSGTFSFIESQVNISSFSARIGLNSTAFGCQTSGRIAGVRG